MSQNYRVLATAFGRYPKESVIPEYELAFAGDVASLIQSGVVEPTNEPVNCEIISPVTDQVPSTTLEVIEENNKLRNDLVATQNQLRHAESQLEEQERHVATLKAELANKVMEIGRLQSLVDQLQEKPKKTS